MALLGVGIGANGVIFSVLDAVLLRSRPVKHTEELELQTSCEGVRS